MDKKKKKEFQFFWEQPIEKMKARMEKDGKARPAAAEDNFFGFNDINREMEQMMNEVMKNFFGGVRMNVRVSAPITLRDNGNEFILRAQLPGFEKKDVDLHISEDKLDIRAEKKKESKQKSDDRIFSESSQTSLFRSFRMPEYIDVEKVEAVFKNSVLFVRLPKAKKKSKTRKVDLG